MPTCLYFLLQQLIQIGKNNIVEPQEIFRESTNKYLTEGTRNILMLPGLHDHLTPNHQKDKLGYLQICYESIIYQEMSFWKHTLYKFCFCQLASHICSGMFSPFPHKNKTA